MMEFLSRKVIFFQSHFLSMVELYRKQKELDFTYENCKKQLFGTEKLSFRTNYFFISKIVYNEECVSKISAHL